MTELPALGSSDSDAAARRAGLHVQLGQPGESTTTRFLPPAPTVGAVAGGPPGQPGDGTTTRFLLSPGVLLAGLGVSLLAAMIVAAGKGAVSVTPGEIVATIAHRVGVNVGSLPDPTTQSVVWDIRLPRVVLAAFVGASLGCAGAAMQGGFSNPLAEPGVVGVSSGAALGAVLSIVVGFTAFGNWSLTAAAFTGGLATVTAVYLTARNNGRTEVVTLLLTGIAVNAATGAAIGLASYLSTDAQLRAITFWTLGSVAQATWPKVAVVAPVAAGGIAILLCQAGRLDLLALGERPARHLGVDVERLRRVLLVGVSLLTAAAVAVSGIIMFVGLAVPHLVRMAAGPTHRNVMPASALGGALVLVACDLAARTIAAPAELPLGVLTALVGAPLFFWLLRQTRRSHGGWA
ncbi:MAG: iron ABC transporter permease [Acidimicrobiales bacterium]|nr:iron ABC transporter permease [Acidimicrobiales bacterium]